MASIVTVPFNPVPPVVSNTPAPSIICSEPPEFESVAVWEVEFDVFDIVCNSLVILPSVAVRVPAEMDIPESESEEMSPSASRPVTVVAVPSLPVILAVP